MYVWPLDKRPKDGAGRHGSLHAKCAVADEAAAFTSSANLTKYALNLMPRKEFMPQPYQPNVGSKKDLGRA